METDVLPVLTAMHYAIEKDCWHTLSAAAHLLGGDIDVWDLVFLAEHRDVGDHINRRDVPGQDANPAAQSACE